MNWVSLLLKCSRSWIVFTWCGIAFHRRSGRTGHTANICPRDDYSPDVPALTCTQCVRRVVTATGGISQFQMVCSIDPCAAHSTLSAQPPTQAAPSALSSAMASLAGATPSQPPAPLNPTQPQPPPLGPNPTNPPTVPNPGPSSSAPPGRNTTRSYSLATIDRKYNQIVSLVNGGTSLEEAYTMTNVKRRTFRRYRTVAEARLVDELSFSNLIRQVENPTLEDCETKGKQDPPENDLKEEAQRTLPSWSLPEATEKMRILNFINMSFQRMCVL